MKVRVCLMLSIIFSFIFISAFPIVSWSYIKFYPVENLIREESSFVENGVKGEYESNLSLEETLDSVLKNVKKYYSKDMLQITENTIKVQNDELKIDINFYENNKKILVEIIITNFSKDKKILNLMKDLSQLQVNTLKSPRYFQYVKGKINNIEEGLNIVTKAKKIEDINALDIHNGYVGTGKLENGERVNFAVSNYDKGTYLVIGTPIIFSTY